MVVNLKKSTIEEELGLKPKIDYKSGEDVEKVFKARQKDVIGLIEEGIDDINQMINNRETLHKDLLKSLDKIETFINNNMPNTTTGTTDDEVRAKQELIKELLKKKIELAELKVHEELELWKDRALLKKELREHMKEFRDTESKTSMIDNMLEM